MDAVGESAPLGFAWSDWFERLKKAESAHSLGSLGRYEILDEVGRGGQGAVFRARQPGTGRVIAIKRLLAGAFASPAELRRFEREVEAASALQHPGIVGILGFEYADGAPLLAMELVHGPTLNEWASGKGMNEILALFLLVCDAVQHAHQRGVLHRDLKPSNVRVDGEGRPRVLDFGLAKLTRDRGASSTDSGAFVGTPAYAAPEQWRGEELDVRADVYALGSMLFEMLTGRRLVQSDDRASMTPPGLPPKPSSVRPWIPREVDLIVLQALASERETRYQSVDALSADLRRFLRGEPVSAHPPGTAYLLKKLVARNRLATALLILLAASGLAYVAAAARSARLLAVERDQALAAGRAEELAREAADEQRALAENESRQAELARVEAEKNREQAQHQRDRAEALLGFLADDVLGSVDPAIHGHDPRLADVLTFAAGRARERFAKAPEAEGAMHIMIGHGLSALGDHEGAARELRLGLGMVERSPSDLSTAPDETGLGGALIELGRYEEADSVLNALVARCESSLSAAPDVAEARESLSKALNELARLDSVRGHLELALQRENRALEFAVDPEESVRIRGNIATLLCDMGRLEEALSMQREDLASLSARRPPYDVELGIVHYQLALTLIEHGEAREAGVHLRNALEIQQHVYGSDHPALVPAMGNLAVCLSESDKDRDEAEELARRALAIAREDTPDGFNSLFASYCLGYVLEARGRLQEALDLQRESLRLNDRQQLGERPDWVLGAKAVVRCLVKLHLPEEAQQWLDRLARAPRPPSPGWVLLWRGQVIALRDGPVEAALWFEEGIPPLESNASERTFVRASLTLYAKILRELEAPEEAAAVEQRMARFGDAPLRPLDEAR